MRALDRPLLGEDLDARDDLDAGRDSGIDQRVRLREQAVQVALPHHHLPETLGRRRSDLRRDVIAEADALRQEKAAWDAEKARIAATVAAVAREKRHEVLRDEVALLRTELVAELRALRTPSSRRGSRACVLQ